MSLGEITIESLRCIASAELALHARRNLIWGGNGSGKTSLLESVFLLGRGRSFRTRNSERLVRHGADRLIVFGRTEGTPGHALGIEVDRHQGTRARADGEAVGSLAELSLAFPVQVIDPEIHKLIEEGGRRRRRWLDWAVFHVEPRFADWWLRYSRALRQRNAALRSSPSQTRAWDSELSTLGEHLSGARRGVVERLQPHWRDALSALDCPAAELQHFQGWTAHLTLAEALESSAARDRARGITHPGPHRADLLLRVAGRPAREVLSRGQQKLVAIALTLAQLRLFRELSRESPTLLLDDPAAELDSAHLRHFVGEIGRLGCQLLITSLQPETTAFGVPDRVFHVEQGGVRPV
jgi:DNA replication and repair protein RecF